MPTPHPDELWRRATAEWAEIIRDSPDLAPATALQQRLLRLMLDGASAVEQSAPAALAEASVLANWQRALPALRNEVVAVPPALKDIVAPLCTVLAEGGAGDSALHVREAITAQHIDADSLLSVSLSRNQKAVRTSALHMGFSPDLVWLIGELASAPLAHYLSARLPAADGWDRGYCPCCGSWPVFIESIDGARALRCSYCAFGWSLRSQRCVYCANGGEDFVAAALDVNRPQRRVELCGRCSGYTKVTEIREPARFPFLAVVDLATMNLDQGAMSRGYQRPELFDLDTIEPRTATC